MSTTSGISNMRAASMPKVSSGHGTSASPHLKLNNLYQQIDSSGTGRITKAQFEQAFSKLSLPASIKGIGQDAAFSKLDPSASGVVSKQEFIRGMQALMTQPNTKVHKENTPEVKSTQALKNLSSNPVPQSQISNILPQTSGGTTGSKINITA